MADGIESEKAAASFVPRDNERFKLLFTNSRPHIPGGKLQPLSFRSTRSLIGERMRDAAPQCEDK